MKSLKQFFTPEHPRFRRWGGASPMLARELSSKALETNYDKLTRSEVMKLWKKADISDSMMTEYQAADNKLHRSSLGGASSPKVWLKKLPSFLGRDQKKSESRMGSPMKLPEKKRKSKADECLPRMSFSSDIQTTPQSSTIQGHRFQGSNIAKGKQMMAKHESFKRASTTSFVCFSAFAPIITAVHVF